MTETDIPSIGQSISELISEIDTRYEREAFEDVEELEALLEEQLESLDAALYEIEDEAEWCSDLEPEPGDGCCIEAQFRAAYAQCLSDPLCFFPGGELVDHLRSVLEGAQVGGMSPAGFHGRADETLLDLARELFWEQRQRIAKLLFRSFSGAV